MSKAAWLTRGLTAALAVLQAGTAGAETLSRLDENGCPLSLEAANPASLQVRTASDCTISASRLQALLDQWLSHAAGRADIQPRSIFLGRLLHYPWLVSALLDGAARSAQWDATLGAARNGQDNQLVAQLLNQSEALQALHNSLEQAGYRLLSVSVEKVLVAEQADLPQPLPAGAQGKLPFDAQLWLVIAPSTP